MNIMKLALLGTAAVAAVSVSARADELSDMKAQIEALNARVASVEAAPAVPAGYQLLSIGKGEATVVPGLVHNDVAYGTDATVISIMPTADMPASSQLSWSGYVRSALIYSDSSGSGNDDISIKARGQLKFDGKTDTAVGTVGAHIEIRGNFHAYGDAGSAEPGFTFNDNNGDGFFGPGEVIATNGVSNNLLMNNAWGYWAVTPELTLGGGYDGSLSGIGYGYDGQCNCYYTDNAPAGYGHGDTTQMRLSWNSGPVSAAIALEDNNASSSNKNNLGVAGEVKFAGDMVSGEISGGAWDSAGTDWRVGAGLGFNMDMFKVGVSAGLGKQNSVKYEKANILLQANLSDAVHGEVGFNWLNTNAGTDSVAALAGIYYDPVDKLTVGLEGEWIDPQGAKNSSVQVDLVTVYRF
jgi:hypothetical protein